MNKSNGFTIIELMTALVIAGVLITLAIPSFSTMIKRNRITTQSNELVAAINYGRSESIKRGEAVSLCRSSDGVSCASSGTWEQGWIVFTDINLNGDYNSLSSPPDELLRVTEGFKGTSVLTPDSSYTDSITVTSEGYATDSGVFVLCDDWNEDGDINDADDFNYGKVISISLTGRVSTQDAPDSTQTDCTP